MKKICNNEKEFFTCIFDAIVDVCREEENDAWDELKRMDYHEMTAHQLECVMMNNLYDVVNAVDDISFNDGRPEVSFENVGHGAEYAPFGLFGLNRLPEGGLFYAFDCGGDWEVPVNGIVYVADGKPAIYFPRKGNRLDVKYNCAYGSEHDESSKMTLEQLDQYQQWREHLVEEHQDDELSPELEMQDIRDFFRSCDKTESLERENETLKEESVCLNRSAMNLELNDAGYHLWWLNK